MSDHRARRWMVGLGLVVATGGCGGRGPGSELSKTDSVGIAEVQAAYVRAWLADDTVGVLATLDTQAVLLPPGRQPVHGHRAIRAYWWPEDGSHTRITGFSWDVTEVLASGRLAAARGTSTVSWTYVKDSVRSERTVRNISLSVLERSSTGAWRIMRQMWGPALQ
jgi:ketosteroid isomerase-like protein